MKDDFDDQHCMSLNSDSIVGRFLSQVFFFCKGDRFQKDACRFITSDKADIVLLQETKCAEVPTGFPVKGFKAFVGENPGKTGHAGVILLSKQKPIKVRFFLNPRKSKNTIFA